MLFIDAIMVKVRDGQVRNRPIYVAIGVTVRRRTRHLGAVGRRRRRGRQVLAAGADRAEEPRRRRRAASLVCDGLKGLPDAINTVWALDHRAGVHHPLDPQHVPLRLPEVLGPDRPGPAADLHRRHRGRGRGPVRASSPRSGASPYPAIIRLWQNAWTEFMPFLDYDVEIRKVICSTNAIE